jgi:RAD51-like protein 2
VRIFTGVQNAWDMLSDEQSRRHINTGSADLNNILGGGIHCKEVTEIGELLLTSLLTKG